MPCVASWRHDPPRRRAQAARQYSGAIFTVNEKDVSGKMTLEAVDASTQGPVLHIKRTTEIRNMQGGWSENHKLDSGRSADECEMIYSPESQLPRFETRYSVRAAYELSIRSSDGAVNPMTVTAERTVKSTWVTMEANPAEPTTQK
jgi:hypothetical protein